MSKGRARILWSIKKCTNKQQVFTVQVSSLQTERKTNTSIKHNWLTNLSCWETDQLAIYKHDRRVELDSTDKQP